MYNTGRGHVLLHTIKRFYFYILCKLGLYRRNNVMAKEDNRMVKMLLEAKGGWLPMFRHTLQNIADGVADPKSEAMYMLDLYKGYTGEIPVCNPPNHTGSPAPIVPYVAPITEVTCDTTLPAVKKPKKATYQVSRVVSIDPAAGASSGDLLLPEGCAIEDLSHVRIMLGGRLLGSPQADGQVTGVRGVSGSIRRTGVFKLVFADANVSTATIDCSAREA